MHPLIAHIQTQLQAVYPPAEAREIAEWLVEEKTGLGRVDLLDENREISIPQLPELIARLQQGEPIQYVLGHCYWGGMDLQVNSYTLIPRPETGELAEWICQHHPQDGLRILDIGTGSGCIALALKKARNTWHVEGMDISEGALTVAKANGEKNGLSVVWTQADVLSNETRHEKVDIVVSNPPYIMEKEKKDMRTNVLRYEPATALFVPDTDSLLFYRKIAQNKWGKWLYFEINEQMGREVAEMLKQMGYTDIEIREDMYGKARMVRCRMEE